MDIKLEEGDTKNVLLERKDLAETSFMSVAIKYHMVWLKVEKSYKLEEIKSILPICILKHSPTLGSTRSSEYLDFLFSSISYHFKEFELILENVEKTFAVTKIIAPLKTRKRIWEKALFDYNKDQSCVVDIGRGSIIATSLNKVADIVEWILKNCTVVRLKNRFYDGRRLITVRGGYRDVLININLSGFLFEIQIHLEDFFKLKEESHEVLNIARAIIEPTLYKLNLIEKMEEKEQLVQTIRNLEQEVANLKIQLKLEVPIDTPRNQDFILRQLKSQQEFIDSIPQKLVEIIQYIVETNLENCATTAFVMTRIEGGNELTLKNEFFKDAIIKGSEIASKIDLKPLAASLIDQLKECNPK
jgi:hypothetical protein